MHPPCEIVPDRILVPVRVILSHRLRSAGMSQHQISEKLMISQVSVNHYLRKDPVKNFEAIERLGIDKRKIDLYIDQMLIDVDKDPYESVYTVCLMCKELRIHKNFCELHTKISPFMKKDCAVCDKLFLTSDKVEEDTIKILAQLGRAVKIIESIPEFAKLIPVYNTDLIYSLPNPRRQTDIAGIPSKIVNFQGLPKSFTYPEMDNFSPISKLLIKLNKYNPKIRAGLNVIYNKKMRETVRDLEYPYFFLNGKINEIREDGVIAFQKPDMGVVAATYVFGTDPDQILNITKKIVLKYVSK